MQLDTLREPFLKHLQLAASFTPSRSPRPVLLDVVLDVTEGRMTLIASDGEISVSTSYQGDHVSGSGRAALPAQTLLSAVRAMPSEEIRIRDNGALHEISGGPAVFKLHGDDPSLFPSVLPELPPATDGGVTVDLMAFLDLVDRTAFAAARDMGRYAFNGVLVELDQHAIVLVATDGRRLSLARMGCDTGLSERRSAIVPVRALSQLAKTVGEAAGEEVPKLRIDLRDDQVTFVIGATRVVAQLVEGDFPDYRAVLPLEKDTPNRARIHRQDLADAIQRAAVTAGDTGRSVEFTLEPGNLRVTSRHEGVGESKSDLEVEYDGASCAIRFNPDFLAEYLRSVPEDAVDFRFKDRSSAGILSSSKDTLYVVMPITS